MLSVVEEESCQKVDVNLQNRLKMVEEYLVHFDLLSEKLEEKGFKQLSTNDLKKFNLKSSIGNFEELHGDDEYPMIDIIKDFSILNNWFIFKKY